jgi:hypothetical protein
MIINIIIKIENNRHDHNKLRMINIGILYVILIKMRIINVVIRNMFIIHMIPMDIITIYTTYDSNKRADKNGTLINMIRISKHDYNNT